MTVVNDSTELLEVIGEVLGDRGSEVQLLQGARSLSEIERFEPGVLFLALRPRPRRQVGPATRRPG